MNLLGAFIQNRNSMHKVNFECAKKKKTESWTVKNLTIAVYLCIYWSYSDCSPFVQSHIQCVRLFLSCRRNWRCLKWRRTQNKINTAYPMKSEKAKRTRKSYISLHIIRIVVDKRYHCLLISLLNLCLSCVYLCDASTVFVLHAHTLAPVRQQFHEHHKHISTSDWDCACCWWNWYQMKYDKTVWNFIWC